MGFLAQLNRSLRTIYAAAFLRSVGVGLTGVILGVYLARGGFSITQIGVVIAAGLAGAALATLAVTFRADKFGRRRTLTLLPTLGAVGGLGFALTSHFWGILVFAFFGMLNGMGADRGPSFALEQAVIPQATSDNHRTAALSWHSLTMDAGHALGALLAALPLLLVKWFQIDLVLSYRMTFGVYAAINLLSASVYLFLPAQMECQRGPVTGSFGTVRISSHTRAVVAKLAALSGLDSLGGGFLPDALIAFLFFRRFGVAEGSLAALFFAGHVLNSISYLGAAWLSRRIGLLNTMVFTHIPSSLFLMAASLAPSAGWAVAFFLGRESLVEMDVPTRQSYVMAIVQPNERTFASGVTNLTRNVARAITPSFAGYLMQSLALAAPFFLGGGIKITYDLLLYGAFRRLKPEEERQGAYQVPERRNRSVAGQTNGGKHFK
ncbi:MAG: MFS transporter [Candidatus Acidiferrales bacterium]